MTNWVDEAADRLEARQNRQQKERDWQLYKATVLPDKAKLLWEDVVASLENAVQSFNERFSAQPERIFNVRKTSEKIEIWRSYFPAARISLYLKVHASQIEWKKTVVPKAGGIHAPSGGRYLLDLHDTGDLYVLDCEGSPIDCEQVSQTLLEPIFLL